MKLRYLPARFCLLSLLILCLPPFLIAQQPVKTPNPVSKPGAEENDVLRIETNLVQVEAIVKDKNGKIVTGLTADDFQIVENNQVHQLNFCSFIEVTEPRKNADSSPGKRLTRNELRRTFVFIINNPIVDIAYFFHDRYRVDSGTYSMRDRSIRASESAAKFLNKFVAEQMGERDLVSIVDTEANLGVFSSFTNDREFLHAAVKQMRSNVGKYTTARITNVNGEFDVNALIQQNLAVLETAQSAVEQLKKVPGRKIVIMLSRALLYNTKLSGTDVIKDKLKQLIARANEAEVTFYYLSPSGLDAPASGAAQKLAEETGGRSIYNTNDVSIGFEEILKENNGYYLLAYDPGQTVNSQPHQIAVRVKQPGLSVQTRSTVYKNETLSGNTNINEQLLRILRSPFATSQVKLIVSPTYQPLTKKSGRISTSINIDPTTVKPEISADGLRHVKLNFAMQITGPDNKLVRQEVKNYTLKLSDESWSKIQSEGLIYKFDTDVNQTGYYQVNVGLCFTNSKQCGSDSRFISTIQAKNDKGSN